MSYVFTHNVVSTTVSQYYDRLSEDDKVMWKLQGSSLFLRNKMLAMLDEQDQKLLKQVDMCDRVERAINKLNDILIK